MGYLDTLLGNSGTPSGAPAAAPSPTPNYSDFYQKLIAAAAANEQAHPSSLFSWLSGSGRDAATTGAAAAAPSAWQQFQQAQDATRNSGLSTMQRFAEPQAMGAGPINPDNPMASVGDYANAMRASLGLPPSGQNAAPASPAPNAPMSLSTPPAPNPVQPMPSAQMIPVADPSAMHAVESGGDPNAVSSAGATGVSQTMPSTLQSPGFGVAPAADNSPAEQQRVGDQYLQALTTKYKSPVVGHIAYNWGPGNTDKWLAAGGQFSKLPTETQQYLGRIAVAQAVPQQGAPQTQLAPQAAPNQIQPPNPDDARRAMLLRMAQMKAFQGDSAGMKQFFDVANLGRPDNTNVSSTTGAFTPTPIATPNGTMTAQDYAAQGARINAAATQAGTNSQTGVQVVGRNGPAVVSQADMLRNGGAGETGADGSPNWLPADSPQYKAIQASQQKEIGDARSDAANANTGLDTATELYNAAHNLYTGNGSAAAQTIRKTLAGISALTGIPVPASIAKSTSQFEQLKYAALNFVQTAAHGFSPRAAVQVVKLIQAAKPGDTTSPQGLQSIITKQVIPAFLRARAMYGATEDYYQKNPLATDAEAQVPNRTPITNYGVKDVNSAQPGDYFIHPKTGLLLQRPMQ